MTSTFFVLVIALFAIRRKLSRGTLSRRAQDHGLF